MGGQEKREIFLILSCIHNYIENSKSWIWEKFCFYCNTVLALWRVIHFSKDPLSLFSLCLIVSSVKPMREISSNFCGLFRKPQLYQNIYNWLKFKRNIPVKKQVNENRNASSETILCHWVHTIDCHIGLQLVHWDRGVGKKIPPQFHVNAILCELQFLTNFWV